MRLFRTLSLCALTPALLGLASSATAATGVTVVVENLAPDNGTYLTPVWVGFHDGTFDTHDLGVAASMELERLAEDGDTSFLMDTLPMTGAGFNQGTIVSDTGIPPLAPGETATMNFQLDEMLDANRYFSYASMVIPSNDAFIANDLSTAHQVFDGSGNFLGALITIYGTDVKDAGTEVNDEIPAHTAFFGQMAPNTGVTENGVVHLHPGYLPVGSGGILDDPMFANADFTAPGYEIARIFIYRSDTVVPAGNVSGTWTAAGSPYILEGDVTVPAGETLIIEPGTTVFASSWYALIVNGHLEAIGTEEEPILFTATPPGPGEPGWKGVRFLNDSSGSILQHCIIENGQVMGVEPYKRGGGVWASNSNPLISHCEIRDNRAVSSGGGVYLSNSDATIEYSTITGNVVGFNASGAGGGVYAIDSSPLLIGNTITDNEVVVSDYFSPARGWGGGVYLLDSDAEVRGNVIASNRIHAAGNVGSYSRGAGLYARNSAPLLANNTLSDNRSEVWSSSGEGAGLYFTVSQPTVVNTIVANSYGSGVHFGDFTTADVSFSAFHANTGGNFSGSSIPAGLGQLVMNNANGDPCDAFYNILLNPQFAAPYAGDYSLLSSSPCIDAGDPTSPLDPDGTIADIGALFFEQQMMTGDVNGDGMVDVLDLLEVLAAWGACPGCSADVNADGVVDVLDLLLVLANWS